MLHHPVVRMLWIVICATCLFGEARAGRPLIIDDADPVDSGSAEIEAGAAYVKQPECKHWDYPFGLTAGLLSGLEAGLGFGGQIEERWEMESPDNVFREHAGGIGDLVLAAKWQLVQACPLGARHALAPSLKFPTANEREGLGSGEMDYDTTWIISRSFGNKAGLHLNIGYSWIGGEEANIAHYGLACDYQLFQSIQLLGEVFAERQFIRTAELTAQFNTGARAALTETLTLDIAAGSKISGDAPDFSGTVGITWTLGTKP